MLVSCHIGGGNSALIMIDAHDRVTSTDHIVFNSTAACICNPQQSTATQHLNQRTFFSIEEYPSLIDGSLGPSSLKGNGNKNYSRSRSKYLLSSTHQWLGTHSRSYWSVERPHTRGLCAQSLPGARSRISMDYWLSSP